VEEEMNKKTLLAFTCALFLACAGLQAIAQSAADKASGAASQSKDQATSAASQTKDDANQAVADPDTKAQVQAKLEKLSSELNLTDDQKTQLKPVLQSEVKQLKAVHDDTSLSPDQKEAKMKEIHEGAKGQIGSILTPEQQQKLAAMKEAHDNDK
jgi:Spy/CpxP family protein refolding chaperone